MKDHNIEQRVRTAVEHAVPEDWDQILAACDAPPPLNLSAVPAPQRKRPVWRSPLAAAAVLLVFCCGVLGFQSWQQGSAVTSVISFDVNPSLQLEVDGKEVVQGTKALNQDAVQILDGMDLEGTQLNVAVNALIGSLLQHGYLNELSSAILISVEDEDAQRASSLEQSLTKEVQSALTHAASAAHILAQVIHPDAALLAQAEAYGISPGKATLVSEIQTQNRDLSFPSLASLSVEELRQMEHGGAGRLPIGRAEAVAAAQRGSGLSDHAILSCEVDVELEDSPAHYEVEFETAGGELEVFVDAYTGAILFTQSDSPISGPSQTPPGFESSAPPPAGGLSQSDAQFIALRDAGVSREQAEALFCSRELEDEGPVYKVSFRTDQAAYEYEIHAQTAAILSRDFEVLSRPQISDPSAPSIGTADAKAAALRHAGFQEDDVRGLRCEAEREHGTVEYEVEFSVNGMEYEYKVDGRGAILSVEVDSQ